MSLEDEKQRRRSDFRTAVGEDCMGWFCERYGWGKLEYEASSPIDLIRLVAARIVQAEKEEKHERNTAAVAGDPGASAACPASSTGKEG